MNTANRNVDRQSWLFRINILNRNLPSYDFHRFQQFRFIVPNWRFFNRKKNEKGNNSVHKQRKFPNVKFLKKVINFEWFVDNIAWGRLHRSWTSVFQFIAPWQKKTSTSLRLWNSLKRIRLRVGLKLLLRKKKSLTSQGNRDNKKKLLSELTATEIIGIPCISMIKCQPDDLRTGHFSNCPVHLFLFWFNLLSQLK